MRGGRRNDFGIARRQIHGLAADKLLPSPEK